MHRDLRVDVVIVYKMDSFNRVKYWRTEKERKYGNNRLYRIKLCTCSLVCWVRGVQKKKGADWILSCYYCASTYKERKDWTMLA